ncbi:DUF2511 domain-containing protein [Pseudomonas baltica]|uniref:DUF2511 domain-containing protein n=1 Tax=Pseudomonas baltica TaxID=2762576 RepID=UPI0028994A03|nr:DUF2511 domain-containing protein [Pseudomonas baltica]
MSLTACKECKHEVSTTAKVCPSCGVSDPGTTATQAVLGLSLVALVVWVGFKVWGFFSPSEHQVAPDVPAVSISASEYGEQWPLTLANGSLSCQSPSWVLFKSNDVTYAVNGSARSRMKQFNWHDISEVQRDVVANGAMWKATVTPLIDRGLALCKHG